MALSNKERQKRWLEKNRALHNFRRRKKNLPVPVLADSRDAGGSNHLHGEARESTHTQSAGLVRKDQQLDSRGGQNPTIEKLRELVKAEQEKPPTQTRTKPDVVGGIYRNDSGGVITKFAWEKLQKMKEKAKDGGYTLDEYSQ